MARRTQWLVVCAALVGSGARADIVNFGKGTLIIPEQASFQTPCGTLASYGLIYRLLEANRPGGYFDPATHPGRRNVTVYWTVGSKSSHNRCIPTNLNKGPDGTSTVGSTGSPGWNDGCDFQVVNALDQPVVPVDYSVDPWTQGTKSGLFADNPLPMRTPGVIGSDSTRNATKKFIELLAQGSGFPTISSPANATNYTSAGNLTLSGGGALASATVQIVDGSGALLGSAKASLLGAWSIKVKLGQAATSSGPGVGASNSAKVYVTVTGGSSVNYDGYQTPEAIPTYVAKTLTAAGGFTTIQYLGGPFIIDASDAQGVIEFLENGDGSNTTVAIPAGTIGAPSLNIVSEFTGAGMSYASLVGRSPTTSVGAGGFFDACSGPRLLENGVRPDGTAAGTDHYVAMHQATTSFAANIARRLNTVPPKIALVDTQSNGDATGSQSMSGLEILDSYLGNAGLYVFNTSSNTDSGGCPGGTKSGCAINGSKPGFLYDRFDADADLVSWGSYTTSILGSTTANGALVYGVLWTPHWEATHGNQSYAFYSGATPSGQNGLNNIASFLNNRGTGLMGECASIASFEAASGSGISISPALAAPSTNFMFTGPVVDNGLTTDDGNWEGMSCTDPNYPNNISAACAAAGGSPCQSSDSSGGSQECVYWDNASSEFAQVGDFHFVQTSGSVDDFKPDPGHSSTYKPGTLVLATTWTQYTKGAYPSGGSCTATAVNGSCNNHWDILDLGQKDNDPTKATVVYVAGHDYQISTVGSRIILNTLLNLGQQPISNERALSAPTVFVDANGAQAGSGGSIAGPAPLVFTGVYDVISGVSSSRFVYSWANGSQWLFPKSPGNVYEHSLVNVGGTSQLGQGSFTFGTGSLWDVQGQMALQLGTGKAGTRNLFTYFGGHITSSASYPNGVLQTGWKASPVSPTEVTNAACVDVLSWGKVSDGKHAPYFGLVTGAGDGVCDLEEATQLVPVSAGSDYGTSEWTANKVQLLLPTNIDAVRGMFQVVEGYCFATSTHADGTGTYTVPSTLSQCNAVLNPVNNPLMGGVVHSTPAVVGPSPNVADKSASRPTVLYTAGADGQVHAFYVSGGSGYGGPTTALANNNPSARSSFANDWLATGSFAPPKPMTELWSFLPASQLPLLSTNAQMVDSAPVVEDIFADFTGTGVRQWRTLLVATAGSPLGNPGAEVFALDVTNPLSPVLVWDLLGSWTGPTGTVAPVALANDGLTASQKNKWIQTSRGAGYPAAGLTATGAYDYSELGSSYGLSLGIVRSGAVPSFPVYLSSNFGHDTANAPLTNGVQVYAINAATGQKMWHWQQPYATSGNVPGDPVPQPVTLLPNAFGALTSVYAVDLEGHFWELPAINGQDAWTGQGVAGSGAIAATSGTSEPLTTPVAIARLPATFGGSAALSVWPSQLVALMGTDGSTDPFVDSSGQVHVVNVDPAARPSTGIGPEDPATTFPISITGQRIYGQISVVGQVAFFSTASKPVTDPLAVDPTAGGATYELDLGNAAGSFSGSSLPYFSSQALYGGVSLYYDPTAGATHVIGLQVSQLSQAVVSNAPVNHALAPGPQNGILYQLLGWMRRMLN